MTRSDVHSFPSWATLKMVLMDSLFLKLFGGEQREENGSMLKSRQSNMKGGIKKRQPSFEIGITITHHTKYPPHKYSSQVHD